MSAVLALEWSSRRVSVALQVKEEMVEEVEWMERFRAPRALSLVRRILDRKNCSAKEITEIRVGRGPGNYSGVRQALAVSSGLSAPGGLPVRAVTSGILYSVSGPDIWVVGDARRGLWWGGAPDGGRVDWRLEPPDFWISSLKDFRVISPEAERLTGLPAGEAFPSALALLALNGADVAESACPLYLHPAVSPGK